MKKWTITLILAAIATITVWAVSYRKDDLTQYIPQEQPVSEQNRKQLETVRKALIRMCCNAEWEKLEKCFSLSKTDRLFAKQENGEDPVEKYLGLLKSYAPQMRNAKWEMTELVKNQNSIFFRFEGENGKKLCVNLTKRKRKYLFHSVEEIEAKKK
ncbi:MAG: hypothetical protein J5806_12800 [Lentisphaeria bacterium]|nr:hypothetical protein [Lentisphaeria bacterium]